MILESTWPITTPLLLTRPNKAAIGSKSDPKALTQLDKAEKLLTAALAANTSADPADLALANAQLGRVYGLKGLYGGLRSGATRARIAGLLGGLLAQELKPFDAARAAVFLHGRAGDNAADEKSQPGIIAGDLIEELPYAFQDIIPR